MNTKTTRSLSLLAAILIALTAISFPTYAQDTVLPERVVIEHTNLFPEGVEYDANAGHFLVGSWGEGTVFAVADDGTLTPFIEDEDLVQSQGLHIDSERNRLLVPNFAPSPDVAEGEKFPISLGSYDLSTGERLAMVDLTELLPDSFSFVNDVTSDADGNAYVTDSPAGAIYKVSLDGEAAVFLQDDRFVDQPVGINGIEFHPDGYLLVGVAGGPPALYKVPLDDPAAMTQIETNMPVGNDGLILHPDGTLIVAGADLHDSPDFPDWEWVTFNLSSDDDWQTATVTQRMVYENFGTTATIRDGTVYTVISHVFAFGDSPNNPVETFEIIRIDFESMN